MKIKGLKYFLLEHCLDESFDLLAWVQKQKEENPGLTDPSIVIDGMVAMWHLYRGLDWVSGGQPRELAVNAQAFVAAFRQCGIEPMFFFAQQTTETLKKDTNERLLQRRKKMMMGRSEEFAEIFAVLKAGREPTWKDNRPPVLPETIGKVSFQAILESLCNAQVLRLELNRSFQLSDFSRANPNCVGILTNRAEWIVLNLDARCRLLFMDENTNISPTSLRAFDQNTLCDQLRLSPAQLPLLATLLVPYDDDLTAFHYRLCGGRPPTNLLIRKVADFVRDYEPGQHTKLNLYNIAMDIYNGDTSHFDEMVYTMEFFQARSFSTVDAHTGESSVALGLDVSGCLAGRLDDEKTDINANKSSAADNWRRIFEVAAASNSGDAVLPFGRDALLSQNVCLSPVLEDLTHDRFPPASQLYKRLRQVLYWVLLNEFPGRVSGGSGDPGSVSGGSGDPGPDSMLVREWCSESDHTGEKPDLVSGTPISGVCHPGLLRLWSEDTSETDEINALRWNIILGAFNIAPCKHAQMKQLPIEQLATVLVLHHLQNQTNDGPLLEEWEINAVLALTLFLSVSHDPHLDQYPAVIRSRDVDLTAVQIASILVRGEMTVWELFSAVGHPLRNEFTKAWLFFDGLWFQHFYSKAKTHSIEVVNAQSSIELLCLNDCNKIRQFQLLKSLIEQD